MTECIYEDADVFHMASRTQKAAKKNNLDLMENIYEDADAFHMAGQPQQAGRKIM